VRVFPSIISAMLLGLLAVPGAASAADLFRFDGRTYGADQASPKLRSLLYDLDNQYYQQRSALADELLFERYLQAEADRRGVGPAELAEELLRIQPPTEAELRAFYDANAARIGNTYEQVRDRIQVHLTAQRLRAAKAKLLAGVKKSGDYQLLLTPPEPPPLDIATDGFPSKGADAPRFTIVEFGDYQCPNCAKAARVLRRIINQYPEEVQVIYMDFPINRSGVSRLVAEGAACAQRQGRFWDYHDLAFEQQSQLDDDAPLALARELDLDEADFAACLAGRAPKTQVARAEAQARRLGLTGTPSIFVNGRPLRSRHLERDLRRLIGGEPRPGQG